jgi:eukaryotic-like serine/threonine-protein kinase
MDREQLLDEVVTAYLKAVEAGQNPDPAEWLARHPDLAAELKEFFAAQQSLDRFAAPLRDLAPPAPNAAEATTIAHPKSPPDLALGVIRYFGDYELLEEIAHVGMGVVYKARQVSLNRIVALKMILAGHLATPSDVQLFQQEAEAATSGRAMCADGILFRPPVPKPTKPGSPPASASTGCWPTIRTMRTSPAVAKPLRRT